VARDPAGHQLLPSGSQGPGSTALFNDTWTCNGTTRTRLQPAACMLAELPFSWCGCAASQAQVASAFGVDPATV
jgi:hypothetical protein